MPRKSRVDSVGMGDKVLEMGLTRGMSVAEIQASLMEEQNVFLTVDQIRNYLKSAPSLAVAEAKALGQEKRLEPIFQYADKVRGIYEEVDQVKARMLATLSSELDVEQQKELVAFVVSKYGVPYENARSIVAEVKRSVVADKAVRLFLSAVQELRRTVELAAKLDGRNEAPPPTPGAGRSDVITTEDLQSIFLEAKRRQAAKEAQLRDAVDTTAREA